MKQRFCSPVFSKKNIFGQFSEKKMSTETCEQAAIPKVTWQIPEYYIQLHLTGFFLFCESSDSNSAWPVSSNAVSTQMIPGPNHHTRMLRKISLSGGSLLHPGVWPQIIINHTPWPSAFTVTSCPPTKNLGLAHRFIKVLTLSPSHRRSSMCMLLFYILKQWYFCLHNNYTLIRHGSHLRPFQKAGPVADATWVNALQSKRECWLRGLSDTFHPSWEYRRGQWQRLNPPSARRERFCLSSSQYREQAASGVELKCPGFYWGKLNTHHPRGGFCQDGDKDVAQEKETGMKRWRRPGTI